MISEKTYEAQEKYNYFQSLVNTKLYLTKEEYNFVINYDITEKVNFYALSKYSISDYLNLNLYSEHDHEKREFEMETSY